MYKKIVLSFIFSLSFGLINSQGIYINREFQESSGSPNFNPLIPYGQHWSKTITGGNGELITVAHSDSTVAGDEDVFLKRITVDGGVVYKISYNTSGTNNDYGIDVTENPGTGDTYVVGVTDNGIPNSTDYDVIVLQYDNTGTLLNSYTYSGGSGLMDLAAAIRINPVSGDIIVAIASEDVSNGYDYLVLQLSSSLGYINEQRYDYTSGSGLPDVPIGLDFDGGGNIILIGASASSAVDWDYCSVAFDVSTLAFIVDDRVSASGFGYDQPLAFCLDKNKDIYITGTSSSDGINYDIRTVKISSNLSTILWDQTYDGTANLEDGGNTIVVDTNGNVIVGGFTTNSGGKKEIIWQKYDGSTGSALWQKTQSSEDPSGDAYVKKVDVDTVSGNVYYVGEQKGKNGFKQTIVGKVPFEIKDNWQYPIFATSAEVLPSDLKVTNDGIYAITVLDAIDNVYQTSKFTELKIDTAKVFYGSASFKKNELIVRFLPSALDTAAIDNHVGTAVRQFMDLKDALTPAAYATVTTALEPTYSYQDIKAVKIFPGLPTTFTSTTSRLGETIPVPDFWTALLLVFPSNVPVHAVNTVFNSIPSIAGYAHPNMLAYLFSTPNDSLHQSQYSTHNNIVFPGCDVNVEEAWDVVPSGGRSYVRGGVFDTGVDWEHSEFGTVGADSSTSKIQGWDFEGNRVQKYWAHGEDGAGGGHGTAATGIIYAQRNNTKGIAGIAGGNSITGSKGIKLFSMRIFDIGGGPPAGFSAPMTYIARAIYTSALTPATLPPITPSSDPYAPQYAFKLNFHNHSWGLYKAPQDTGVFQYHPQNITLFSEALHEVNRLKVTTIAARGQAAGSSTSYPYNPTGTLSTYPANCDDDWVICVTGTGTDGKFAHDGLVAPFSGSNADLTAGWRGDIDLAAPAASTLNLTLRSAYWPGAKYQYFGGTSASAPYVSGAVGLMMTNVNDTTGADVYTNMAPEDCEAILQLSATDIDSSNYDQVSGHGRLNVGKALRLLEKPYYELHHFGTNFRFSYSVNKIALSGIDTIKTIERFHPYGTLSGIYRQVGQYKVKTFKITSTVYHNLASKDTIKAYWPRPSSSVTWNKWENIGGTKFITPREKTKIVSCSQGSAILEGYVYQATDMTGNSLGWWPVDTSYNNITYGSWAEYSVLTRNLNNDVGIKGKIKSSSFVKIYPNPTGDNQNLEIDLERECNLTIELYDLMGRKLRTVHSGKSMPSITRISHSVADLPNSMYIYNVNIDGITTSYKFIKQ